MLTAFLKTFILLPDFYKYYIIIYEFIIWYKFILLNKYEICLITYKF